jgi:hypothetical protein
MDSESIGFSVYTSALMCQQSALASTVGTAMQMCQQTAPPTKCVSLSPSDVVDEDFETVSDIVDSDCYQAKTSPYQAADFASAPKPAPPGGINFGVPEGIDKSRKLSVSSSSSRGAANSRGRGVASPSRGARAGGIFKPKPQITAMSLAAGGLIKQSINTDNYPPSIWDRDNSVLLNVQLLNSESFQAITGLEPPASPIDAKTYAAYGMPFYDIWNEELSGFKGNFGVVKSVAMLDEGLGTGDFGGFWSKVTGGGEAKEEKEKAFVGEEPVKFPVVMLDLSQKRTFRPLQELEEEVSRLKFRA